MPRSSASLVYYSQQRKLLNIEIEDQRSEIKVFPFDIIRESYHIPQFVFSRFVQSLQFEMNPYLYRATKDGRTIHLFGTMHNLYYDVLPLGLRRFLQSFDILLSEAGSFPIEDDMPVAIVTPKQSLRVKSSFFSFKDSENHIITTSWFELLNLQQQMFCYDRWRSVGIDERKLGKLIKNRPDILLECLVSLPYEIAMDDVLIEKYEDIRKVVLPLEKSWERISGIPPTEIYDKYSGGPFYDYQIDEFVEVIIRAYNYSAIPFDGADLAKSYWQGNVVYESQDNVRRNKIWLERLKLYQEEHDGNMLLACGASHLIGRDSLLDLLEQEGFEVRKLGLCDLPGV